MPTSMRFLRRVRDLPASAWRIVSPTSWGVGYLPERAPIDTVRDEDLAAVGLDAASWAAVRDEMAAVMEEAVMGLGNLSA